MLTSAVPLSSPALLTASDDAFQVRALFRSFPAYLEHQADKIPRSQINQFTLQQPNPFSPCLFLV